MKKQYLLTYDVKDAHQYILTELKIQGWKSTISGWSLQEPNTPVICYLPETTWWKEFYNKEEAWNEFKNIAGENNISRACITIFDEAICTIQNPMHHQIEEAKKMNLKND